MAHPAASNSDSTESKFGCKDLRIQISGKGTCEIEKVVCPAASDSTENKELLIDIRGKATFPITKMVRRTATDKMEDILTKQIDPARWDESCIYKVPKKLCDINKKAYSPKLISIGPLHHGQKELEDMELQKQRYFQEFFNRKGTDQKITLVKQLAGIIKENEVKIRHCYAAETSKFSTEKFVNMILLDAIFIIELFLRNVKWIEKESSKENPSRKELNHCYVPSELQNLLLSVDPSDYMFSEKWLSYNLKQDLLLLENQLPFFILEELWKKSNCCGHHVEEEHGKTCKYFLSHAFTYFYELHPEHNQIPSQKDVRAIDQHFTYFEENVDQLDLRRKKVKHFTDMLRYFFYSELLKPNPNEAVGKCMELKKFTDKLGNFSCFCSEGESEDGGSIKHLHTATQLDEAGVKFKRVKHRRLLDIKFKKNLWLNYFPFLNCSWLLNCLPCLTFLKITQPFLEVPTFEVNDETECVFRNLMAFEQCNPQSDPYICNYFLLLDRLINSSNDVDLLVDEKVIVNFLGSNQRVATLVNKLCLEIVEPEEKDSPYKDLSKRLNEHYRYCWNKNMASLTRLYFRDFWRGSATVVGIIVLAFTFWNFHRLLQLKSPKDLKLQ